MYVFTSKSGLIDQDHREESCHLQHNFPRETACVGSADH